MPLLLLLLFLKFCIIIFYLTYTRFCWSLVHSLYLKAYFLNLNRKFYPFFNYLWKKSWFSLSLSLSTKTCTERCSSVFCIGFQRSCSTFHLFLLVFFFGFGGVGWGGGDGWVLAPPHRNSSSPLCKFGQVALLPITWDKIPITCVLCKCLCCRQRLKSFLMVWYREEELRKLKLNLRSSLEDHMSKLLWQNYPSQTREMTPILWSYLSCFMVAILEVNMIHLV